VNRFAEPATNLPFLFEVNVAVAVLMKGVLVELQKLNAQKQKVFA